MGKRERRVTREEMEELTVMAVEAFSSMARAAKEGEEAIRRMFETMDAMIRQGVAELERAAERKRRKRR